MLSDLTAVFAYHPNTGQTFCFASEIDESRSERSSGAVLICCMISIVMNAVTGVMSSKGGSRMARDSMMPGPEQVEEQSGVYRTLPIEQLAELDPSTWLGAEPAIISRVTIEKLFGRYSYTFPTDSMETLFGKYRRLILLYGDNGSGKTTILRLVFHLLSPESRRSHRTFIVQTPFQRLAVNFANGIVIEASRPDGIWEGAFTMSVTRDSVEILRVEFSPNEEGIIPTRRSRAEMRDERRLLGFIEDLGLGVYFLADDRSIYSDTIDDEDDDLVQVSRRQRFLVEQRLRLAHGDEYDAGDTIRDRELFRAVNHAETWLRQQAFRATSSGSENANALYLEVLDRIATSVALPHGEPSGTDNAMLTQRLHELGHRTEQFAKYGLATPLSADRFVSILLHAPGDRTNLLKGVLTPHLDGIQAQLDALQPLQQLLETFTSSVNSFFTDKTIHFNLTRGITIITSEGLELSPAKLSSGERQLLLLLCNVLVARDTTRLFIIDEPELSLNVKWQRQLLDALLDCTTGTEMQFLVATHSIEMVAGHRESLAKLVNARGG